MKGVRASPRGNRDRSQRRTQYAVAGAAWVSRVPSTPEHRGRLDVWRESSDVWWYQRRSGRYEERLEIDERPPKTDVGTGTTPRTELGGTPRAVADIVRRRPTADVVALVEPLDDAICRLRCPAQLHFTVTATRWRTSPRSATSPRSCPNRKTWDRSGRT